VRKFVFNVSFPSSFHESVPLGGSSSLCSGSLLYRVSICGDDVLFRDDALLPARGFPSRVLPFPFGCTQVPGLLQENPKYAPFLHRQVPTRVFFLVLVFPVPVGEVASPFRRFGLSPSVFFFSLRRHKLRGFLIWSSFPLDDRHWPKWSPGFSSHFPELEVGSFFLPIFIPQEDASFGKVIDLLRPPFSSNFPWPPHWSASFEVEQAAGAWGEPVFLSGSLFRRLGTVVAVFSLQSELPWRHRTARV